MKEIECGFLTFHPTLAGMGDIVRYKGQWTPESLITGGINSKRFSDAELMAEYWAAYGEANATMTANPRLPFSRRHALRRFANNPNHDDQST